MERGNSRSSGRQRAKVVGHNPLPANKSEDLAAVDNAGAFPEHPRMASFLVSQEVESARGSTADLGLVAVLLLGISPGGAGV